MWNCWVLSAFSEMYFGKDCAALGIVFCTMKHSGQSEDTRIALPQMVDIEQIIHSEAFIIQRKEKEELVLIFSGLLELYLHCIFANCFFFLSFVYTEVEIHAQLNITYLLQLYYICKSGRLHCLILGPRCQNEVQKAKEHPS